jgi:hypothetical protein
MADLLRGGAVFVHIPKCGGSWVCNALAAQGILRARVGFKHSPPDQLASILRHRPWHFIRCWLRHPGLTPPRLREAFKFTFVRNPVRWYESYWKFMAGAWHPWEPGRWHPQRPIDTCADDDFNRFVGNVLRERPGYVSEMYGWYTDRGVDYIGRCERLCDDLIEALGRAGEQFDAAALRTFPRVNESSARRGQPVWNPDLLRRIVEVERPAIERFGYSREVEALCAAAASPCP